MVKATPENFIFLATVNIHHPIRESFVLDTLKRKIPPNSLRKVQDRSLEIITAINNYPYSVFHYKLDQRNIYLITPSISFGKVSQQKIFHHFCLLEGISPLYEFHTECNWIELYKFMDNELDTNKPFVYIAKNDKDKFLMKQEIRLFSSQSFSKTSKRRCLIEEVAIKIHQRDFNILVSEKNDQLDLAIIRLYWIDNTLYLTPRREKKVLQLANEKNAHLKGRPTTFVRYDADHALDLAEKLKTLSISC